MNSKKIIYWGNICPSFFIFSSTSSNNVIIPITVTLTYDENGNYVTRKDECRNEQCKLKISSGVVGTTILKIFKSKQYFRCKYMIIPRLTSVHFLISVLSHCCMFEIYINKAA